MTHATVFRIAGLLAVAALALACGGPGKEPAGGGAAATPASVPAAIDGRRPPAELPVDRAVNYAPRPEGTLTFNKDIAPIIFDNCTVCHRPGEIAPIELMSYADVKQRASQIAVVTGTRYMPPWLPAPGYTAFRDPRGLSDDQIGMIRQWVDEGAVEGSPDDLPPLPTWTRGWQLGTPDLVIGVDRAYTLRADGPDVFRNFVVPSPVREDRFVRAVEFRPGNASAVHHAQIEVDRTRSSRRLDGEDPEVGFEGMHSEGASPPDGHFIGWVPGRVPSMGEERMAWRIGADTDLVLQLHMIPTGKRERVKPSVGLFFSDSPPEEIPVMIRLGSRTHDIAAGVSEYVIEDSYTLPVDVEVLGLAPHAHYIGQDMMGFATLPDGSKRWLLRIYDWDFNWQDDYRFATPLRLPKGTILAMRYTYDNSVDNPQNPHVPPRRVVFGPNTTDEMGDLWIQVVPTSRSDLEPLRADYARYDVEREVARHRVMVAREPDDPKHHNNLGHQLMRTGNPAEALAHFERSVALDPGYAAARKNLAIALYNVRRYPEAIDNFRHALQLVPDDADGHATLGQIYGSVGKMDEAIEQLTRAIALRPGLPRAHYNLGRAYEMTGRGREAVEHYTRSLELEPNWLQAIHAAAWLMSTSTDDRLRNPGRAIALAQRGVEISESRDPIMLETLAAAYASDNRFAEAIESGERALALAGTLQTQQLVPRIRRQLELYRQGIPYRELPDARRN